MQTITKNTNNTLYFTLTEKVTLTTPFFLVRVEGRSSSIVKRFILPSDQSSYTDRYNKFTITESTTEILTSGTITLTSGDYDYRVYEQSSSTNLDELEATVKTPIEYGLLKVLGTDNTYNAPLDEKEYKYPT
ncbi:MAG: hypothetical protein A2Z57_11140 [Planctomycetes bacterium RIFCSPHIGHO2_12_39_6]|nr:MAG: hypothetical protein A2Z57_11140 [Planctomycetes bacterium RIFCSPHIGHO2_12_39_6]